MIYLYVFVCFYSGQLSHLPSCFVAGVANLNVLRVFAASPLLRVFRAIVNKKQCDCEARRLLYVAGRPLLKRRCTRLPGCFHSPKT